MANVCYESPGQKEIPAEQKEIHPHHKEIPAEQKEILTGQEEIPAVQPFLKVRFHEI